MPLATELLEDLIAKFEGEEDVLDWLNWLKQRIKWLDGTDSGGADRINVEQVFDLAYFDIEASRMEQHLSSVGQNAGDTPWQTAEHIETWLGWMEYFLRDVIWDRQKRAMNDLGVIERFTRNLRAEDVVVSFNYDTLVEASLTKLKRDWNYGFKLEGDRGLKVLKMHGSINWFMTPRDQDSSFEGYPLLFRKSDRNRDLKGFKATGEAEYDYVLRRCPDEYLDNRITHRDLQRGDKQYYIGIAGLGRYKPLHKLPGTGEVWFNAMKALREADEVYIVGFSLSPYDSMARLHFGGEMLKRTEERRLPKKVVLVDPNAVELKDNFQSVFSADVQIESHPKKAEKADWATLLG
jgi:hypothetical protein